MRLLKATRQSVRRALLGAQPPKLKAFATDGLLDRIAREFIGGALSGGIAPAAVHGPCWRGSLFASGSPAKARNPMVVSDLKT
jgi:hypothetical protein